MIHDSEKMVLKLLDSERKKGRKKDMLLTDIFISQYSAGKERFKFFF